MASLLDMNFNDINLDKLFGTTVNPVAGLITDPNFENTKNVSTFAPMIANVIKEAYAQEKYIPEILVNSYLLGGAGRQSAIDKATKGYMTQQDILKDTLAIQKAKGDLAMQPLEMMFKRGQIQQQPYDLDKIKAELRLKGLETIEKETRLQGYSNYINTLSPEMKDQFAAMGPEKFFEVNKITDQERVMYEAFGIKDRFNMTPQQANLVARYNVLSDQKDVDTYNQSEYQKAQQDPLYKPNYKEGKLDFLKNYANRTGGQENAQAVTSQYQQASVQQNQVRTADGKVMSQDEYNKLPRRVQSYLDPTLDVNTYRTQKIKIEDERSADKSMVYYGLSTTRDVARDIEQILNDPEALDILFSQTGRMRLKFNEATGNWFAESGGKATDVANMLNKLKNKQFTQQIQRMRANNKTGGAVGNVSDREVSMFQNMQEYLGIAGNRDTLYVALTDLYNKAQEIDNEYQMALIEDYGQEHWTDLLQKTRHTYKQYPSNFGEAYKNQKIEQVKDRMGVSNPAFSKESLKYLNKNKGN
jgi:hypothetical protein